MSQATVVFSGGRRADDPLDTQRLWAQAAGRPAGAADMRKRKLAIFLASSMGLVWAVDLALGIGLASLHRPFIIPLLSMCACIPGLVVAGLAWQGRLPHRLGCNPS